MKHYFYHVCNSNVLFQLQQCLSFAVCAEGCETAEEQSDDEVRTSQVPEQSEGKTKVMKQQSLPFTVLKLYSLLTSFSIARLQQPLPFTVCTEGCETAEEQRDDEVRTSQVPERSEGKTKVIGQQPLPFTVLKLPCSRPHLPCRTVATALTVHCMRRRGAKRR